MLPRKVDFGSGLKLSFLGSRRPVKFIQEEKIMRLRTVVFVALALPAVMIGFSAQDSVTWPASTPEEVGLDPNVLARFEADIAAGKYGHIDGLLIIRHGKLVYDRSYRHDYDRIYGQEAKEPGALNAHDPTGPYNYFNPWWHPFYRRGDLHTLQSVTKTVTSVVIGVARARGEFPDLATPILKFYDESKVANVDERKRRVTIRHLLTMTGGFDWDEELPYNDPKNTASLMEASFDWVEFTINRKMAREPGTVFNYSSGESELLAHIFHAATGRDIEEYAAEHLFAPLGIERFFWKRSPSGPVDTEGGLYLTSHDLAKIADLFLNKGVWRGKAIVSPDWVTDSVTPKVEVDKSGVKYGLKWWIFPYGDGSHAAWAGSGFGGQMPIIVPELNLVLVFTGWNILPGKPRLSHREAIERVLRAVVDCTGSDP
jgi:CubicO group peptidase (beta-lactamase class C family)